MPAVVSRAAATSQTHVRSLPKRRGVTCSMVLPVANRRCMPKIEMQSSRRLSPTTTATSLVRHDVERLNDGINNFCEVGRETAPRAAQPLSC